MKDTLDDWLIGMLFVCMFGLVEDNVLYLSSSFLNQIDNKHKLIIVPLEITLKIQGKNSNLDWDLNLELSDL